MQEGIPSYVSVIDGVAFRNLLTRLHAPTVWLMLFPILPSKRGESFGVTWSCNTNGAHTVP